MTKSKYRLCKITALALLIAGTACGGDSNPYIEFTSITPDHGPQGGGNIVVVKGAGFASPGAELNRFLSGDELAVDIQVVSNQELRVTMPAHGAAEVVDIEIFNGNGSATLEAAYSYNPTPTVTDASPGNGPSVGGTEVTLTGTGFLDLEAGDNLVDFDGIPATVLSVVSDTELKVESPPGVPPKLRDIRVTNENGSGTRETAFDYQSNGNSLLAFTRGLLGYGTALSDPLAGQVLHVDLETLTIETAFPAPGGEFNGVITTATDGISVFMRTVSGNIKAMDPKTGVITTIGRFPADDCNEARLTDLEFHQGVLYGFCRRNRTTPHFGRINTTTLEFTPIGPAPLNNNSAGRTTLVSNGSTLYIIGRNQETNLNRIVSIDPGTGLLGLEVPILLDSVRGGAFLNGRLYVLNQAFAAGGGGGDRQAYLYELDINTGAATQIMPLGLNLHGLTVAP